MFPLWAHTAAAAGVGVQVCSSKPDLPGHFRETLLGVPSSEGETLKFVITKCIRDIHRQKAWQQ